MLCDISSGHFAGLPGRIANVTGGTEGALTRRVLDRVVLFTGARALTSGAEQLIAPARAESPCTASSPLSLFVYLASDANKWQRLCHYCTTTTDDTVSLFVLIARRLIG